jgi:MoaA/NifB/PqqE/SkfB family radical SAM enzyme
VSLLSSPVTASGVAPLRVRRTPGVRIRPVGREAIAYVPRRDHFFALDSRHTALVRGLREDRWGTAAAEPAEAARTLAELGICETDPATPRRAFAGRSVVGSMTELPISREPLVVNCFATSFCPLRCRYCHADDLMVGYREGENDRWLAQVLRVAGATPAMVGVVTGGEPLARYERTERLVERLAETGKAVVLDTSGVGDFSRLVPLLRRHDVHVRVSLDSADAALNDDLRPANRGFTAPGTSSSVYALDAIRRAVRAGVPCSVQTVVTVRNWDLPALLALRDRLVGLGVTTWVLHLVVPVGKAARAGLLPGPDAPAVLAELASRTAADGVPIDVRVTSTGRAPNSTLLISAEGEFAVEQADGGGKRRRPLPRLGTRGAVLRHFRRHVDLRGHADRYLNGSLEPYRRSTGAVLPRA